MGGGGSNKEDIKVAVLSFCPPPLHRSLSYYVKTETQSSDTNQKVSLVWKWSTLGYNYQRSLISPTCTCRWLCPRCSEEYAFGKWNTSSVLVFLGPLRIAPQWEGKREANTQALALLPPSEFWGLNPGDHGLQRA